MRLSTLIPSVGSLFASVLGAGVMWSVWMMMKEPDLSPPRKLPEVDAKLLQELKQHIAWYNAIPADERSSQKGVGEEPITEEPEKIYRGVQEYKWDYCSDGFWYDRPYWRPDPKESYQPWMMDEFPIYSKISEAPYRACVKQFDQLSEVYGETEMRAKYWELKRIAIAKRLSGAALVLATILVVLYAIVRAAVQSPRRSVAVSA